MDLSVCVCGAGTMGSGIAYTTAANGIYTVLYDLNADSLVAAAMQVRKELQTAVEKKRLNEAESKNIWNRILFTSTLSDCRAEIIIEAIIENTEAKSALFKSLATYNEADTLFATNTSSLSVALIAEQTPFPEKVIGMHFFNPVTRMKLVEIVKTKYVADDTVKRISDLVMRLKKTAVICQNAPGFIVNHVARPYYLEAMRLLEEGVAEIGSIDKIMQSAGFKMGPFHLMDLIGNDINYAVSCSLYESMGEPTRLQPVSMQEKLVKQGKLGIKTGGGFFQYQ